MEDQYITIPAERYVDLLRAEHTALMLLNIIQKKNDHYCGIDHNEIKLMHTIFCGYVGEEE
jgi:hypothetical protein